MKLESQLDFGKLSVDPMPDSTGNQPNHTIHDCLPLHPIQIRCLSAVLQFFAHTVRPKMVAVFNKELLSWYLITIKLKETLDTSLPKSQPPIPSAASNPRPLLLTKGKSKSKLMPPPPAGAAEPYWIIYIRDRLNEAHQVETSCPWAKLSVYRIPKSLHNSGDDMSYTPQLVSLGPYHHGKRRLREMEHHKWRAVHHVLARTGHDIQLYLDAVMALEERVRARYEVEAHTMSSTDFITMMVLDGCFALELLRGVAGEGFSCLGYARSDPVFAMRGIMHSIQRDMIMLENQIPLFLLDCLYGIQISRPDQCGLVARLAIRFFDPLMPTDEPLRQADRTQLESRGAASSAAAFDPLSEGGLHCLDVFRNSLLRCYGPQPAPIRWMRRWSHKRGVADKRQQQLIHCVTELREAGVKFCCRRTDRFWDVRFEQGVLEVPRILIHDGTKSLFLNLIAFEQCHIDCGNEITSYVIFMNNLINSEEDVSYLHYRGIIEHWLGNDDEVADLFNRLCEEVVFDMNDSYLSGLSDQVNTYYNHRWNAWRATLKHNYFNNPWAIVSFIAAVFLLLLTFVQTFYTVYAYHWPSS